MDNRDIDTVQIRSTKKNPNQRTRLLSRYRCLVHWHPLASAVECFQADDIF